MGRPVRGGPTPSEDVSTLYFPTVLSAFPSPASDTASLNSPTLTSVLSRSRSYSGLATPRVGLIEAAHVVSAEPDDIRTESVMTPPADEQPEPDLNVVVGGTLSPNPLTSNPTPSARMPHELRLPSFERLGIAAPHPDRLHGIGLDATVPGAERRERHRHSSAPCVGHEFGHLPDEVRMGHHVPNALSDSLLPKAPDPPICSPLHRYDEPLTPPADQIDMDWNLAIRVQAAAMDSPSAELGEVSTGVNELASVEGTAVRGGLTGVVGQAGEYVEDDGSDDDPLWIKGGLDVILENLRSVAMPASSVRILSHALPSPSASGHVFPRVIGAINATTPAAVSSPMIWINVFHAVPGRFNLADIPQSPPNTPGPAVGGDDYFTQKVFDSAVSIADYQEDLSALPRSPLPVVQPSSIDVSIVERYIPPSSTNEFTNMFDSNGPSILVDRLIELSPNHGSLLFIYPTKTGAQTFMKEYLGPLLDPILRTMVVVYGLSSDMSRTLGGMNAADQLLEHEALQHRITSLCARLTQQSTAAERFYGRRPAFSVSYASKKQVMLERQSWARDWWTKQEKIRVRDAVTRYIQERQKKGSNDYGEGNATSTELVQKLLDGVAKKQAYHQGEEPEHGVEVSVFVIKRTA